MSLSALFKRDASDVSSKKGCESTTTSISTSRAEDTTLTTLTNTNESPSPPVNEIEVRKIFTYKLSCGACKQLENGDDNARCSYTGTTDRDLASAFRGHSKELWDILQLTQGRDVNKTATATESSELESEFVCSSLGQHLITTHFNYPNNVKSEKQIFKWWKQNVTVRVQTHKYEKRPETDGTSFNFAKQPESKPVFVQHQQQKEEHWEKEKTKQEQQRHQQMMESNALLKEDVFDVVWKQRYDELEKFANENEGSTNVPRDYADNPMLGIWVEKQRIQYRRKHNIRPKLELEAAGRAALTDEKEVLLKAISFAWHDADDAPKQRWDEKGISVMYGCKY